MKIKNDEKKELKGEKMKKLIFLVYLNNKYGKGNNNISELETMVGYSSPGGIYDAINNSGYFEKTINGITLTDQGRKVLEKELLAPYQITNIVSYFVIFFGVLMLFQWAEWTYVNELVIIPWYSSLIVIIVGLAIRFLMVRFSYWIIKRNKKVGI